MGASLVESDFVFKIQGKIKEEFKISLTSINKNNYNELNKICDKIQEHFLNSSKLILNDKEIVILTPKKTL